ncbi:hypothetical protein GACE_0544 [Geoglobus acetivorans]|uniref:Uncharacterized protein n=1 Tax=Geoglobus acetivorans TaxID=565033 RepID=A0A0A7GF81_GEOAI|nr:hypothetical protein GACE_0544 [Geoglobus acetivorans]
MPYVSRRKGIAVEIRPRPITSEGSAGVILTNGMARSVGMSRFEKVICSEEYSFPNLFRRMNSTA